MVKLRCVYEDRNHIENLRVLLKYYSKDRDRWNSEWTVNPYYLVDLGKYGNCVCGHLTTKKKSHAALARG